MNFSLPDAISPRRSREGYWTHPHYFTPEGDTEGPGEFNAWLTAHSLECNVRWMREETPDLISPYRTSGNVSRWQPVKPPGTGWFIGSLHDTDMGAVCIWLRQRTL